MVKRERIFEIDALRGICIIGMIGVHLWMNYCDFFQNSNYPAFLQFFFDWGGVVFVLLSGIAVTLGHHPVKRGLIVLGAGLLCTAVTYAMDQWEFAIIPIWFGVLHCLGICMLTAPLLQRLPRWCLPLFGLILIGLGFWAEGITVETPYWFIFGLRSAGFSSGDYFPLFPHLGWFILGMSIGYSAYQKKITRFPKVNSQSLPIRALCFCGRHTLWIYLAHQPVLYGIFYWITA